MNPSPTKNKVLRVVYVSSFIAKHYCFQIFVSQVTWCNEPAVNYRHDITRFYFQLFKTLQYSLEENSCKVGCKWCKQWRSPLPVLHRSVVGVSEIFWIFCHTKGGKEQLHICIMTEVKHSGRLRFLILQFATTRFHHNCYCFVYSLIVLCFLQI